MSICRQLIRVSTRLILQRASCQVQARRHNVQNISNLRLMYWRGRDHNVLQLPPPKRSDFLDWNLRAELFAFTQRIQERISEVGIRVAFTDESYVRAEVDKLKAAGLEPSLDIEHNERLAALGEQTLSPLVSSYLRYFLPKLPEEGIRAVHDYLLSTEALADMARWLGAKDLILSSEREPSVDMLARTFRAVIGIIAQEHGKEHTRRFVIDFVMPYLQDQHPLELWNIESPKKLLNQLLANEGRPEYEPRLLWETGRNTMEPCFVVGVYSNKELLGSSGGESLEVAEDMAALEALKQLFEIRPNDFTFKFGPVAHKIDFGPYEEKENQTLSSWSSNINASKTGKRSNVQS